MKKAYIHFAEGFEEIEAITVVDVLRRAEIPVVMVSVTENNEVTGSHGITVYTDVLFEDADYENADILILPGGQPGTNNLNRHTGLKKVITEFNNSGRYIAAICAAPLVLGGLDILKGKKAVCFPGYENQLKGATVLSDPVVVSGNIITGRGPGVALEFSLRIVSELNGKNIADKLAGSMIVQNWR